MAGHSNAAPVIIKRKKIIAGGGHHGGAWKVAYADFVTAMMAFFMLMWLLNATTEKQRKGIADYFSPTIPLSRISGGGDGSFGGESVFSEDQIAQNGTGASSMRPSHENQAAGQTGTEENKDAIDKGQFEKDARKVQDALLGTGGESMISENLMRHVNTRLTDEGLIIEFFDRRDEPVFLDDTAEPAPITREFAEVLVPILALVRNQVAVGGHLRAQSRALRVDTTWDLSATRAMAMRQLLESAGLERDRLQRVTGFADRSPAVRNPLSLRNNRVEIILLRKEK